jgi:hypothetical protein
MANQKISDLTALTRADLADDDVLAIVDTSSTETKKITAPSLRDRVFLSSTTIASGSAVSSVDYDNTLITTEYSHYEIELKDIKSTTDNAYINVRLGNNNSADTSSVYRYWLQDVGRSSLDTSQWYWLSGWDVSAIYLGAYNSRTGTGANDSWNGVIVVKDNRVNTRETNISASTDYFTTLDSQLGIWTGGTTVNFITVYGHPSANIYGTFKLYGVR